MSKHPEGNSPTPAACRRAGRRSRPALWLLLAVFALGGCATYHPQPLPGRPDLKKSLPESAAASRGAALPGFAAAAVREGKGLDMTTVATLAVLGNPDLKAARRKADVAWAQVFAAGLLPDPDLSLSLDHPTDSQPDLVNAYSLGLDYPVGALVTRGAATAAARAAAGKVDLNILWKEWQVIQQARILYVRILAGERKTGILQKAEKLFAQRYARSSAALKRGDLTINVVGTDLTALVDAQNQLAAARRRLEQVRQDLNALLGLMPDVKLPLAPLPASSLLPRTTLDRALGNLPRRRPDLLALQAGYRSQEELVRKAILAQFPSVSVGFTRARDTSDVHTIGFGISLNLPFFNANRGEIAVQRATRARLKQEYQARLDQAWSQASALWERQQYFKKELDVIDNHLPGLQTMVRQAEKAYRLGDIDALTYLNLQNTLLQKRLEREDLLQELWTARIGLDTLLGLPAAAQSGRRSGARP